MWFGWTVGREVTLLEEIDNRQNELLDQLDELNQQVLALLDDCTKRDAAELEAAESEDASGESVPDGNELVANETNSSKPGSPNTVSAKPKSPRKVAKAQETIAANGETSKSESGEDGIVAAQTNPPEDAQGDVPLPEAA